MSLKITSNPSHVIWDAQTSYIRINVSKKAALEVSTTLQEKKSEKAQKKIFPLVKLTKISRKAFLKASTMTLINFPRLLFFFSAKTISLVVERESLQKKSKKFLKLNIFFLLLQANTA